MTVQRWLFVIIACLLLLLTVGFIYFNEIQNPQWAAIKAAKKQAIEAAELTKVEKVYHHTWNKETWIIEGINKEDENVFVWLAEEKLPEVTKASEGISAQDLKATFKSKQPKAVVKRIQPGLLEGQRVWEIYYSDGENPAHYHYDFYRFDNGNFIDSYKLPSRTEP
ncbi:DUF5590 domain-containing protein [Paenibacillus sp. LHD-38]|uniref:cell wall elongation regulator TseB-like domain-containing protein n=1 Tax=Paenibacillus sp. LHD-38 TaxID=3072143 RepID=UPI00280D426B|nr:DUF5590 domain-containing protein [Paenibacillus sp. LHD-38]MDQ8735409.1 DUF5590 domain-containing protein [Paenibacillus sp. LHD-38]